jgi:hypothetical protein
LTTAPILVNSVRTNTVPSLYPVPKCDRYYVTYLKTDAAKEPLAAGPSIPAILADASGKTGGPKSDFTIEEISKERYETLKQFLDS